MKGRRERNRERRKTMEVMKDELVEKKTLGVFNIF